MPTRIATRARARLRRGRRASRGVCGEECARAGGGGGPAGAVGGVAGVRGGVGGWGRGEEGGARDAWGETRVYGRDEGGDV